MCFLCFFPMMAAAAARPGRPPCCRGDRPRRRAAPRAPGRRGRAGAAARRPLAGRRYGERRCSPRRRRGGRRLAWPGQVRRGGGSCALLRSAPRRAAAVSRGVRRFCVVSSLLGRARPCSAREGGVGWGVQAGRAPFLGQRCLSRALGLPRPLPSQPAAALSPPAAAGELPPAPLEMPLAPCLRRAASAALPFLFLTLGSLGQRSVSVALAGFSLNTQQPVLQGLPHHGCKSQGASVTLAKGVLGKSAFLKA